MDDYSYTDPRTGTTWRWDPESRRWGAAGAPHGGPAAPQRRQRAPYIAAGLLTVMVLLPLVALSLLAVAVWRHGATPTPTPIATTSVTPTPTRTGRPPTKPKDALIPSGPLNVSAIQRAYFLEVGFTAGDDNVLARWTKPVVRVAVHGRTLPGDRRVVAEMLATVNSTIDSPHFVYQTTRPDVVIRFVDHTEFERHNTLGPDTIGICTQRWSRSYGFTGGPIYIDNRSDYRSERAGVLYHEFGHSLGLNDTSSVRYRKTIMYKSANHVMSFTALDLAALRILYDPLVKAGYSRDDVRIAWRAD